MAKPRPSARRSKRSSQQLRIRGRALSIGDRTLPLYSGAVHYWRLDRDAWEPSLKQVRDLGLSLVETYVPWGVHELGTGELDFGERDPRKDVGAFLDLAKELGLYAIVRPGPHINAELTFLGLPARIVYDSACQARSPRQAPVILPFPPRMFPVPSHASRTFAEETGKWMDAVGAVVGPRLWPAGNVVMLQVDNECSYYFRDAAYDQDYHPDARAEWRRFLEKRYGSLEKLADAHHATYPSWEQVEPPVRFTAREPSELVLHLDWAAFKEELITSFIAKLKRRMAKAGLKGVPTLHNLPLGDQGMAPSPPALAEVVDLVGLDYYHARREHRAIKRRTAYLAGTFELPYAPELGVGAPAWFTPLGHDDSLFTAMTALAYGLRGFNLYMAVDRDRWYGAPIDAQGNPRVEAGAWKHLIGKLHELELHKLERRAEVGIVLPREYGRLSKVTALLGPVGPTWLEGVFGSPTAACREDPLGFAGPVQVLWWKMAARFAEALTAAGIPYVYVDGDAPADRLAALRVLITPSYEYCDPARWKRVTSFAEEGGHVVYGPAMPSLDLRMRRTPFEVPKGGRRVLIDTDQDAHAVVAELAHGRELRRPFPVGPAPLETCVHEDDKGARVLFVINPGRRALTATIELASPIALEDLMSAERFAGAESVRIPMQGRSCRMLATLGAAREGEGRQVAS